MYLTIDVPKVQRSGDALTGGGLGVFPQSPPRGQPRSGGGLTSGISRRFRLLREAQKKSPVIF